MAERHLYCPLCEQKLAIPRTWTADYAMTWFYVEHVREHAAEVIVRLTEMLKVGALCRPCRAHTVLRRPEHRPCFEVECSCACSHTPTTTERTAHADG